MYVCPLPLTLGQVLQSRKTSLGSLSGQEGLCQYAVEDEEEALAKGLDPSVAGTTINITDLYYGKKKRASKQRHPAMRDSRVGSGWLRLADNPLVCLRGGNY